MNTFDFPDKQVYFLRMIKEKKQVRSFHYAWVIVAVASMSYFFSGPGQTYFISLFIDEYIDTFQWNRSVVSGLYSGATLLSGLLMFFVGRFSDRIGKKRMMILASSLLALTCVWNSFIISQLMLLVGFFFSRFLGQGTMTLVPSTLVPVWFEKRRGIAMSLMSVGGIVGGASVPVINAFLIRGWGWEWTWRFWAILLAVICVPVFLVFMKDHPSDIGSKPYVLEKGKERLLRVDQNKESFTIREAMRTRSFWLMLFCQIIFPMVGTGVVFHLVSILGQQGIDRTQTAMLMSIISIIAFPSTLLAGIVLDRVPVRLVIATMNVFYIVGLVFLLINDNIWIAGAFAVFQGVVTGLNAVSFAYMWPAYFGTEHLGSIRGFSMSATVVGSAIGPIPFGFLFDRTGAYGTTILAMILVVTLGAVASLIAKRPVKRA
ncbi:MAG: MFS transporter [Clostridiales bacterium]|nr:MFS transporter [Clostridiales bacterium]